MHRYYIGIDSSNERITIRDERWWPLIFGGGGLIAAAIAVPIVAREWSNLSAMNALMLLLVFSGFTCGCAYTLTFPYRCHVILIVRNCQATIAWTTLLRKQCSQHELTAPIRFDVYASEGTEGEWFTPAVADSLGVWRPLGFGFGVEMPAKTIVEALRALHLAC